MTQFFSTSGKPACWGKSYEDGNRECRNCGVQGSCKDEVIRNNVNRPAFSFYQPYQQQTFQAPAPQPPTYYQVPAPQPTYQQVQFRPTYQPQQVPVQSVQTQFRPPVPQQQMAPPYQYGWVQDPLQYQLFSSPPPFRPQLDGETFFERVVKNTGLAMLESILGSMLLAVRQMVLEPPNHQVVDASPQIPQPVPMPQPPPKIGN